MPVNVRQRRTYSIRFRSRECRMRLNYGEADREYLLARCPARFCFGKRARVLDNGSCCRWRARARARYQKREESWVLARGRLPAAYQTLFRSAVRFGDSIVDTRNCAHSELGPVILHDSPFCPPLSTFPPRPPRHRAINTTRTEAICRAEVSGSPIVSNRCRGSSGVSRSSRNSLFPASADGRWILNTESQRSAPRVNTRYTAN